MTSRAIICEFPQALIAGPVAAALVLAWAIWVQRRRGATWQRVIAMNSLRLVVFGAWCFLLARPVWLAQPPVSAGSAKVAVLVDRSESMSLEAGDSTRYLAAIRFFRDQLLPALKSAGLPVQGLAFAAEAEIADGEKLASTAPNGKRTNLAGAIAQAFSAGAQAPLAVIALTDGCANEHSENNRALTALLEAGTPFIGIGLGDDAGAKTLTLRQVYAPPTVASKTAFQISAQIESVQPDTMPAFELLLFRDGKLAGKKTVQSGKGSRQWMEQFRVTEEKEGSHVFTVQMIPPDVPHLKCPSTALNAPVRVSDEREVRVLYIQGAMTWDYKFVSLALRNDPSIKVTGLTRTSKQSIFRQNVENAGELLNGFPADIEQLSPFRVLVLSNLKPSDLTPAQEEMLAKFCGELGGGVLMMGGPATFDSSWQKTRLEQLLPVVFSSNQGVLGLDRPFRIELTDEALQHPVFQISDGGKTRELWSQLPSFTEYGRVDAGKPGAEVWLRHQSDEGPKGRRILMAVEHYGAGLSAVLCIQNFWRWRLAKDSDPQLFDRFWRQLFRYLADVGSPTVLIQLADQEIHPDMEVHVTLEKQPSPSEIKRAAGKFMVMAEDGKKKVLRQEAVDLEPGRPVEFRFHAGAADTYTVSVLDPQKVPVGSRLIEIRDVNLEFQDTGRNMETLRQWAAVSGGFAVKVEDCRDASEIANQIKMKAEEIRRSRQTRTPVGVNGWVLALGLGCLSAEWLLRKRWGFV